MQTPRCSPTVTHLNLHSFLLMLCQTRRGAALASEPRISFRRPLSTPAPRPR